jgi:hypothetical protein
MKWLIIGNYLIFKHKNIARLLLYRELRIYSVAVSAKEKRSERAIRLYNNECIEREPTTATITRKKSF